MSVISLKVRESDPNMVGKKMVLVDVETKRALNISHGDFLLIKGKKETVVQAWPGRPSDEGLGIIRMDSFTRRNAGVSLGDDVEVSVVQSDTAKRVIFAPTHPIKFNGDSYLRLIKKQYINKPVTIGDELMFSIFGTPFTLSVQKTIPKGVVSIEEGTEIEVLETPISPDAVISSKTSFEDIGGLSEEINKVREMIELPLRRPEVFKSLGIEPPKGILLYGPPGTGKTMIAKAISNEANAHFIVINGPSIMSKYVGGAEERLRAIFKEAQENAPAIIFIDEIDGIAPRREEVSSDVEMRVVGQLLSLMDGLEARGEVVVIGATNRPNSIDDALRRPGRFDREIDVGVPDKNGRREILKIMTRFISLEKDVDLDKIVNLTHGFVGADLSALLKEAGINCLRRNAILDMKGDISEDFLDKLKISYEDIVNALKDVQPSALREVFTEVPNVKWDEIGALDSVKHELRKAVEWPIKYPEEYSKLGIDQLKGVLLYGPPGTGKTLLAKAIASETECNFISIKGPELFSKWLGDSERAIRKIFHKARQTAPCIVFFDEIDAIATKRDGDDSGTSQRVVNQLLTELDGLNNSKGVVMIAATNRLNIIDNALLRPGRIDKILYVGLPDENGRYDILSKITRKVKLSEDVNLEFWALKSQDFSGADLSSLVREAGLISLDRNNMKANKITNKDFEDAYDKISSSKSLVRCD